MKIGIDFSITSPSLCIETDNKYRFISLFERNNQDWKNSKSKKFQYHRELDGVIDLYGFNRYIDKTDYRSEQRTKMKCANDLSQYVVYTIVRELQRSDEPVLSCTNPITIGIEGFSYGSKSSSSLDLVMYQSFLRSQLMNNFPYMNMHIISPMEAKKKLSGKGNADKEEMIRSFQENRLEDEILVNTKFHKYIREKEIDFKNVKPIDDLVDSYAILKSI